MNLFTQTCLKISITVFDWHSTITVVSLVADATWLIILTSASLQLNQLSVTPADSASTPDVASIAENLI